MDGFAVKSFFYLVFQRSIIFYNSGFFISKNIPLKPLLSAGS